MFLIFSAQTRVPSTYPVHSAESNIVPIINANAHPAINSRNAANKYPVIPVNAAVNNIKSFISVDTLLILSRGNTVDLRGFKFWGLLDFLI